MLPDPIPAPEAAARSGAPFHCQEPMQLAPSAPAASPSGEGLALDWRCRCGFRLDAGLVPLPFSASHDAGLVVS